MNNKDYVIFERIIDLFVGNPNTAYNAQNICNRGIVQKVEQAYHYLDILNNTRFNGIPLIKYVNDESATTTYNLEEFRSYGGFKQLDKDTKKKESLLYPNQQKPIVWWKSLDAWAKIISITEAVVLIILAINTNNLSNEIQEQKKFIKNKDAIISRMKKDSLNQLTSITNLRSNMEKLKNDHDSIIKVKSKK